MEVREFSDKDRDTFFALCKEFYEAKATQRGFDQETAQKTFQHIMDHHENLWGLLILEGETNTPIGYSLITSYWCNEEGGNVLVLDELYIAPICRHKGYASLFMRWLQESYKKQAVSITLEVLTTNVTACGLYMKEGYQPDGFTTYTKRIQE